MATRRAIRKRMRNKFQVGDVVTWGHGLVSHRVIAVQPSGVVVDTTSAGVGRSDDAGRLVMFIEFASGSRSDRCPGPPRHSNLEPDRDPTPLMRRRVRPGV
jgi:hypothetical protein